jgi:hypothetical protein
MGLRAIHVEGVGQFALTDSTSAFTERKRASYRERGQQILR